MACGEIGLKIEYFYSLYPRQFFNIVEGYNKKEERLKKERWEIGRLVAFNSAFNFESKDKHLTPTKWLPFDWEKKPVKDKPNKPKQTIAEIKEKFKQYDKQIEIAKSKKEIEK